MSALAGLWNFDGKPGAREGCARMLASQAMYARDGTAQWDGDSIALGRGLYRTLPEDIQDRQPIEGARGRRVLVADLRLDNREELIGDLRLSIERAGTMADAEILFAAWGRWGVACLDRLVGDYAFAVWDADHRQLILARDPMGMRPLHYHRGKTFFAFASMPKGLHALPEIPYAPDEERVAEFLALLPESGSRSYFADIEVVEAGHVATVTATGVATRRHWEPQRKTIALTSPADYAEGLRHHLDNAVRARLRGADGRVGAHLSAGFDSSIVATSAARQLAPSGGKVVAFTAVPREGFAGAVPHGRFGDEGPIAAKTAALYDNIEYVPVRTAGCSPLANLDRNFRIYERPVLNLCNAVWVDAINDEMRARKLQILLTGQMGNMTISYDGWTLLPQLIAKGRWFQWQREVQGMLRNRHMRWTGVLAQSFGPFIPKFMWLWALELSGKATRDISSYSGINAERLKALDIPARAKARNLDLHYRPRKDGFETRLWVLRRVDMGNYNKGILGGWGIDQRDPTADRRLIEFSLGVPDDQFLHGGVTKALTRRAFADRLPSEVFGLRGKGYQAADWYEGLTAIRGALAEEIVRQEACGPASEAVDLPRLKQLVENWPKGGWEKETVMVPYRLALMRGLSAGHFLRKAVRSNA
jgi:asparagine synthase (glutamine-hydrolysing)